MDDDIAQIVSTIGADYIWFLDDLFRKNIFFEKKRKDMIEVIEAINTIYKELPDDKKKNPEIANEHRLMFIEFGYRYDTLAKLNKLSLLAKKLLASIS